jgi:hypothetical protein
MNKIFEQSLDTHARLPIHFMELLSEEQGGDMAKLRRVHGHPIDLRIAMFSHDVYSIIDISETGIPTSPGGALEASTTILHTPYGPHPKDVIGGILNPLTSEVMGFATNSRDVVEYLKETGTFDVEVIDGKPNPIAYNREAVKDGKSHPTQRQWRVF